MRSVNKSLCGVVRRAFSEEKPVEIECEEVLIERFNQNPGSRMSPNEAEYVFPLKPSKNFEYTILGKEFQSVEIRLAHSQRLLARAGSLAYMTDSVSFKTQLVGGVKDSISRTTSGSSAFLLEFLNQPGSSNAKLLLSPQHPSKIIPIDLTEYNNSLICHKNSFLCGDISTKIAATFVANPVLGVFGGEGFALQMLKGDGVTLIAGGGVLLKKRLREEEEIRLSPGSILAMESTVKYKLQRVKGFSNIMFGQGLFFVKVQGPGDVFVQSLSFEKMAKNIAGYLKTGISSTTGGLL